jgi:serine/threonine-protein kinase HipA
MRKAGVYRNGEFAGTLTEENRNSYIFEYDEIYYSDSSKPSVSLTLPKTNRIYKSTFLFPFFYNMVSEGVNKKLQSMRLKIDENDNFGLLLAVAQYDTIGAITIKPLEKNT